MYLEYRKNNISRDEKALTDLHVYISNVITISIKQHVHVFQLTSS